jgi:hypothetical protein
MPATEQASPFLEIHLFLFVIPASEPGSPFLEKKSL